MNLTDFLLARVAEDEQAARLAVEGPWLRWHDQEGIPGWDGFIVIGDAAEEGEECNPVARVYTADDAAHIIRWHGDRVLAECDAKRRIVTEVAPSVDRLQDAVDSEWGVFDESVSERLMRLLALPYAEHRDYDNAWRP